MIKRQRYNLIRLLVFFLLPPSLVPRPSLYTAILGHMPVELLYNVPPGTGLPDGSFTRSATASKLAHSLLSLFPTMAPFVGLHRLSLVILAAGLISVGPVAIVAQTSTAVCLSSFDWVRRSTLPEVFTLTMTLITR